MSPTPSAIDVLRHGHRPEITPAPAPPPVSRRRHSRGGAVVLTVAAGIAATAIATGSASARPADPARVTPAAYAVTAAASSPTQVALALKALQPGGQAAPDRASRGVARAPLHRWVRPNYGPLTSSFGYRWGRLHEGIDLGGAYGSPILAATDGCITYAGPEDGYGEVIKIADWDGTQTVYGHMSSFVRTSGCVKAGDLIARVGAAGDAIGAHLHFGVYIGGAPVDPIPFLAKRGLYI
jgi:murein DD-endopeptidase MepM/ murein hydrolase activator NlpD